MNKKKFQSKILAIFWRQNIIFAIRTSEKKKRTKYFSVLYFTLYSYKDEFKFQCKEYYHKAELQRTAQYKSLIELG